jgi:hypothetical protein
MTTATTPKTKFTAAQLAIPFDAIANSGFYVTPPSSLNFDGLMQAVEHLKPSNVKYPTDDERFFGYLSFDKDKFPKSLERGCPIATVLDQYFDVALAEHDIKWNEPNEYYISRLPAKAHVIEEFTVDGEFDKKGLELCVARHLIAMLLKDLSQCGTTYSIDPAQGWLTFETCYDNKFKVHIWSDLSEDTEFYNLSFGLRLDKREALLDAIEPWVGQVRELLKREDDGSDYYLMSAYTPIVQQVLAQWELSYNRVVISKTLGENDYDLGICNDKTPQRLFDSGNYQVIATLDRSIFHS